MDHFSASPSSFCALSSLAEICSNLASTEVLPIPCDFKFDSVLNQNDLNETSMLHSLMPMNMLLCASELQGSIYSYSITTYILCFP